MKIAPIYDPTQRRPSPKPVQGDLRKAFIIGICCWVVALIVSIVVFSTAHSEMSRQSMFICSYGVLIGFALLVWEHFHRRDYRRLISPASSADSGTSGSTRLNVLPCPGLLHTCTLPWCMMATCLTMARPRPTPDCVRSFWFAPR